MNTRIPKALSHWGIVALMLAMMNACVGTAPQTDREHQEIHDPETTELQPVPLGAGEKLSVVATTNIVGDVVGQVGGDRIELTTLMDVGQDPHTYVPTPADTAAIHDADVVFASGVDLEANLDEMFSSAGGDAVQVHISHGLELLGSETGRAEAHDEDGHRYGGDDPHVWFNVQNVIQWVNNLEHTLSALDPDSAEVYEENAQAYIHQLEELDAWVMEQVAQVPEANRKLVTNHPALGYFADRYGLEQVGAVYPISPSAEPSARDIAALEDAIRAYGVPAVFVETTVNPNLAELVAQDTGVKLVPLYTGSLGEPGSGAESYILLIRFDVNAIVDALK